MTNFDSQNPPATQLIDACVHCGFCLATCPSYRVIGKEMDSPRGRIYLMDAIHQGEAKIDDTTAQHFDSCLGCLACVTTCPSGVRYDQLIAATRPQIERNQSRPLIDKLIRSLIFNLFPYPKRLGLFLPLLQIYQQSGMQRLLRQTGILPKVSPRLAAMEAILPQISRNSSRGDFPRLIPPQGERRYRVGMILGCVQRLFFDPVNQATARVLSANGCEIVIPASQGCCAALPAHQGQEAQAQTLARQMIDSFADESLDAIIINAAGCGHTLKEYGHILDSDPEYRTKAQEFAHKVKDVQEFLAEIEFQPELHPITSEALTLVYQDACHLLHGQKIREQPRQLLQSIPGVQLQEAADAGLCCGSAGIYNMLQPETADELGRQKALNLVNTGAAVIASANPGCSLQIQKHLEQTGSDVGIMHPIELLDYAIRGEKLPLKS